MIRTLSFLFFIFFYASCNSQDSSHSITKRTAPSVVYTYKEIPLPVFFDQLFRNHYPEFKEKYGSEYTGVCEKYALEQNDSLNQELFFKLKFFQQLMTSESPSNCSQKGALKIPYFWNWVNPNPRSEIIFLENGLTLDKVKPGMEFSKYKSYAFVDRIPSLFLQDLVSEKPKYFHPSCDTLYTFGWCSEREMAFNLLMSFYYYQGKVIVNGAHSWSEFWVEFRNTNKARKSLIVKVDNTYDGFVLCDIPPNSAKAAWLTDLGKESLAKWYNEKANSIIEKNKIEKTIIKKQAGIRIERLVLDFFK